MFLGDSVVYDESGNPFTIENLLNDVSKKEVFIYSLNESTLKLEKTRINTIVKHINPKKMLRITTSINNYVDVTLDHKIMVNRDGNFTWVESQKLLKDDMILMPKNIKRNIINKIDFNKVSNKIIIKDDEISLGNDTLNINVSNFDLYRFLYTFGCLNSIGSYNVKDGNITLISSNVQNLHLFSHFLSESCLVEASIEKNNITITNKLLCLMFKYVEENLINFGDEYLYAYLSGFLDCSRICGK